MFTKYKFKKFTKAERSSFSYWYYHWKAFNLTAYHLGHWKFKYLFHDIEKPFLKLILRDYKKVQKIHRKYNSHHLEYYKGIDKVNYIDLIIDWECSQYTKLASPNNAREEVQMKYLTNEISENVYNKLLITLDNLNL